VSAPGEAIRSAVPGPFDPDGDQDGWAALSGASFAAPMAAAVATWIRAVRPGLHAGQVHAFLCASARVLGRPGWDAATGCGAVDVGRALGLPAPPVDPLEPNDDVPWVDGIGFGTPSRPVWRGEPHRTVRATVTAIDDTTDVYRLVRPARSAARVVVRPRGGGVRLRILDAQALDVTDRRWMLADSRRRGPGVERATVVNRTTRRRVAYVVVTHDAAAGARTARYMLTVSRARHG
jgi:hypothetical protein